ncbi:hypothetical protein HDU93_002334, partial [Gonapodya sp. JEL0774]
RRHSNLGRSSGCHVVGTVGVSTEEPAAVLLWFTSNHPGNAGQEVQSDPSTERGEGRRKLGCYHRLL